MPLYESTVRERSGLAALRFWEALRFCYDSIVREQIGRAHV